MALGVEEEVGRFEVAVDQVAGVQLFQGFEELLDDVFFVDFFQDVGSDDCVEVCFHVVENALDIFIILCSDYI